MIIRFSDIGQALANLHAQKTRTLLTALGIVFGVGSVIGMLAIGSGAKDFVFVEFDDRFFGCEVYAGFQNAV